MNFSRLSKIKIENNNGNNSILNSIPSIEFSNENNIEYNQKKNITVIEEKNILLTTSNYTFEIKYTKMKTGSEYFTILNKYGQYCIRIKKDIENINDIYLQHLNFFESCSKNKSLLRKSGTIEMLLAILQYVRDFYGIGEFKYIFQDDSSINILGHHLKLNLIYILLYGKTWYMKNVNAIALSSEFNQNLEEFNKYLDSNKDNITKFFRNYFENSNENANKNNISENIISSDFINLIAKNNTTITKNKIWKDIKNIYSLSSSSRDFLESLYKKYGMAIFIILNYYDYYHYISIKIKVSINFNILMMIPNDFINSINVIV
jgi:hypothetical protein